MLHLYAELNSLLRLAAMLQALHAFRDNKASFLLATPQAARGLDLPAVSHVYNLDIPQDAITYLHRAGRAGRIGSPVPGAMPLLCVQLLDSQMMVLYTVY